MQFDKEVSRAQRGDSNFQLLMLDLDRFKAVNDNFGHKVGDRMLKEVGKLILDQLRDYDFLSRYAGDEFVALIGDTRARDMGELCDRIERAVREFILDISMDKQANVGVSLGAASYPEDGVAFDELIVEADKKMYSRKLAHKVKLSVSDAEQTSGPEMKIEEVSQFVGPLEVEAPHESELSSDTYVVELDETHIVSAAVN
jgi:diguanylate cyclase (GGDEF)-like protein